MTSMYNKNLITYLRIGHKQAIFSDGGNFEEIKKLRNIKNKFSKFYDTSFIPSKELDKKKLMDVVLKWKKNRPKVEKNYYTQMYLNFIKNDFEGNDIARSVVVNNEPCTITAGWKIPNSNNYYSSIGILDYSYPGLGEIANIDDLNRLKRKGYDYVDFGGSDKVLLYFKRKFKPEKIYKTYVFSIVRS